MADQRGRVSTKIVDPTTAANEARVTASGNIGVDIGASVTLTVDSELPAAAALADNTANPTVPGVGAFALVFDGSTWDRLPGNSAGGVYAQGNVASDIPVTANPLLNGARASTAAPTAVSADGDAVAVWANRLGAQKIVIVDDAGDSAMDGANDAVRVNMVAGTGFPTKVDDAAFTVAVDSVSPAGFLADETSTDTVDEGDIGAARIDVSRRQLVRIVGATDANRMDIDASGRPTVNVNGTVTVDSELPAAASLADNTANPTVPGVGAFAMVFDGSTWDRLPGNSVGGVYAQGNVAADVPVTAQPLLSGGRASSAVPTAMSADGDAVSLWLDRSGGSIINGRDAHDAALDANTNPALIGGRASAAAPTDVSADGDAVRAWFLRNGAQAAVITAAGALIGGDATNGLDVDVTRVTGTVTVDSELPAAAALADATANPTVPGVGGFLMGFNGTTWDRVRTANTGRLQVDVITGGGTNTPTNPVVNPQTSSALAAGSSVALTTAEAAAKKLRKVTVWSSVPFKATLHTVDNSVESGVKAYGGGPAYGTWTFDTPHQNYVTLGTTAGTDAFRVNVTNLDNNSAADVYMTAFYED